MGTFIKFSGEKIAKDVVLCACICITKEHAYENIRLLIWWSFAFERFLYIHLIYRAEYM